jgi:hypothetical protein
VVNHNEPGKIARLSIVSTIIMYPGIDLAEAQCN